MTSCDDSLVDAEIEQLQDLASSSPTGIRPVTIRQLLDATRPHSAAKFSINDIVVDRVSTVAQVRDIQGRPSSITYMLDDGTSESLILARQWLSDGGETLPEGHVGYVQVVGHLDLKAQSGSKNVLIVKSIRALTDPADRLFFHLTQVAFATLCFERGTPPVSALVQAAPRFASSEPPQEPHSLPRSVPPTPQRTAAGGTGAVACTSSDSKALASPSRSRQQVGRRPTPESSPEAVRPQSEHVEPAPANVASRAVSPSPIRVSTPVSVPSPPRTPRGNIVTAAQAPSGGARRRQSGIKRDPYAHLTVLQRAILLQILNTQYAEGGSDVFTISRGVAHHNPTAEQIGDELDFLVNEGFIETTVDTGHYAIRTSHYPTSP